MCLYVLNPCVCLTDRCNPSILKMTPHCFTSYRVSVLGNGQGWEQSRYSYRYLKILNKSLCIVLLQLFSNVKFLLPSHIINSIECNWKSLNLYNNKMNSNCACRSMLKIWKSKIDRNVSLKLVCNLNHPAV